MASVHLTLTAQLMHPVAHSGDSVGLDQIIVMPASPPQHPHQSLIPQPRTDLKAVATQTLTAQAMHPAAQSGDSVVLESNTATGGIKKCNNDFHS